MTLADYFQKEMKGFFFPLLAKNVENIEFISKQNHCKILNAIALTRGKGAEKVLHAQQVETSRMER